MTSVSFKKLGGSLTVLRKEIVTKMQHTRTCNTAEAVLRGKNGGITTNTNEVQRIIKEYYENVLP
jgi:hypothetical protein